MREGGGREGGGNELVDGKRGKMDEGVEADGWRKEDGWIGEG